MLNHERIGPLSDFDCSESAPAPVIVSQREQVQSTTGLTLLPLHHKSAVAAMHFSQAATAISHLLLSSTCVTDASVAALALCLRDMPWVKVRPNPKNPNRTRSTLEFIMGAV
jgi:hypothetical protein